MTHLNEEDLVLLYYREPSAPADGQRHLNECMECAEAFAALSRTLQLCSEWEVPQPEADYERSVWVQLVPRMTVAKAAPRWRMRWLAPVMMTVLVGGFFVGGVIVGRISGPRESTVTAGLSAQARQRILAISLADHLDRTETLLTEISNWDEGADFGSARARAQDLVDEGRLMRQAVAASGQMATLGLLDDVERFMLEVANGQPDAEPGRVEPDELRVLRQRIGERSLLFKVRIIESNLRMEGQKS